MKKNKNLRKVGVFLLICFAVVFSSLASVDKSKSSNGKWVVVDTGQDRCFDNVQQVSCPGPGAAFHGQDAQYNGTQPSYTDNGNGTVTDNNTGLMWQETPGSKMTWSSAVANASSFNLAGYTDWRLPTIKELYSLIDFNGVTGYSAASSTPYIDTAYFDFNYGNTFAGERFIDAQYCSGTEYGSTTMNGNATIFGVNFADGRIKGYPKYDKLYDVRYVRGRSGYGTNNFIDNNDGIVTDLSTGLMWMKYDSGYFKAGDNKDGKLDWQQALDWAESLDYVGYSDWRLPNAKELQGIVDYTRSPAVTNSPAIDPVFDTTSIIDGNGQVNYPFFWTGTTHLNGMSPGATAVYIAFGEAQGYLRTPTGSYTLVDVHGAGAQRSDPKSGDPNDYPFGRGPQGDVICIYNFVRCVRDVPIVPGNSTFALTVQSSPAGVAVTVSPADTGDSGNGTTSFTRSYTNGTNVTLTAPVAYNGKPFSKWSLDGTNSTGTTVQVTMDSDHTATAYYTGQEGLPGIILDMLRLNYGMIRGGEATPSQTLRIGSDGEGTLDWTAETGETWLKLSSGSGIGDGTVTVSVEGGGLAVGIYVGTITVSDANASNSPQTVKVHLHVYNSGSAPFGSFDSPVDGSTVQGSIPVSGWVLDDIAVDRVMIYRLKSGAPVYIGDALLVEGARPDVELAYPDQPFNNKAGWGYMLLTNTLPDGDSGTFTLVVEVRDMEGHSMSLGSKIITCDNGNAVEPFGAIDAPTQGGTVSGSSFINWGWVLTPLPSSIPIDGSTIDVYVDGVKLGHPVYNVYKGDIAAMFPGYANSNGAGGYFYLDTTAYQNGVHTIAWTAVDDAGNTGGIGSRYFTIRNSSVDSGQWAVDFKGELPQRLGDFSRIPVDHLASIKMKKGYTPGIASQTVYPDGKGIINIEIKELERIEVQMAGDMALEAADAVYSGFLRVGEQLQPLPPGSTLDSHNGVFYWQPGPGFLGRYDFVFIMKNGSGTGKRIPISVVIAGLKSHGAAV